MMSVFSLVSEMRCDAVWHHAGAAMRAKFISWQQGRSAVHTVAVGGCGKDRLRHSRWRPRRRISLQCLAIIDAPTSTCDVRATRTCSDPRTLHSEGKANPRLRQIHPERTNRDRFPQIPTQGCLPAPDINKIMLARMYSKSTAFNHDE
jgi:hypothetical protein